MSDPELLAAIQADPAALALATAGNDAGCAARMAAILPPELASTYVNERGIFAVFPDSADAEQVMQALEATAAGFPSATPPVAPNPVVKRALAWMQPNNGGIDLSYASVRGMLDSMAGGGLITPAQAAALKGLAERPATVTADDVSRVMLPGRTNGRVS